MVLRKRHVKLILVLSTILIGLSWYVVKRENDYFTHLNRITKRFIIEMEQQHEFSCFSVGGSFTSNIKEISIKFNCYEKKSIEEARILEIDCIEHFCKMINSNKKIRPHLEEFPFPSKSVGIMICFCKKDLTNFPPEESISIVMSCREKLIYKMEFDDHRPDQTILREPYDEAYEKVKGTSSNAQKVALQPQYHRQSSESKKSVLQGSESSIFNDAQQSALECEFRALEENYGFKKKAR